MRLAVDFQERPVRLHRFRFNRRSFFPCLCSEVMGMFDLNGRSFWASVDHMLGGEVVFSVRSRTGSNADPFAWACFQMPVERRVFWPRDLASFLTEAFERGWRG